jgi:hypothetical protein
MTIKCECGQLYNKPKVWPIRCKCARIIYEKDEKIEEFIPKTLTPNCECIHRGDPVAIVDCGCKGNTNVYKCTIYELCMIRKLKPATPEFIINNQKIKQELQYCNFCKDRTES